MKYLRRLFVLALLLVSTGPAFSQVVGDPTLLRNGPKILLVFREVVAQPSESTVRILADGKEVALGTIVDADGWIITKWSEIDPKIDPNKRGKISVKLKDGKLLKAKIVGVMDDEQNVKGAYDLAMLKIDATGLKAVKCGNSKEATVGRWVASPGTGADPVAIGVVSVATRLHAPGDQPAWFDSGYLGVALAPGMGGAKISAVTPKSAAAKAGIEANDIVYEAAGRKITDPDSLINIVGRMKPGDKVLLKIKRGDEDIDANVTLGTRPANLKGNPQETMGAKLSKRRGGFPVILQHDSGLAPENCGGPLVDLDGNTVGINIARAGRTETYAIPAENIQTLLADLKSGKLAPKDNSIAKVRTPEFNETGSLATGDKLEKRRPGKCFMKVEEVQFAKGVTYIIEMTAVVGDDKKQIDPYLILEDAKGMKLAEDDDSGGDLNAKIVFRAPADGVYRIICTTFNPSETGNYTLSVRRHTEVKEKK